MRRLLLVDDEVAITQSCRLVLEDRGFEVREVNDSSEALSAAREFVPDAVLLDFAMPGLHGGDVAWQFFSDAELRSLLVIMITGTDAVDVRRMLPPTNAIILPKPMNCDEVLRVLAGSAILPA